MKIERTQNAIRNVKWGYISKVINLVVPFILRTVIIKKLGVEYVGINSLFTSILQVLSLSELGVGTAIVYSMYEPIAQNNDQEICALLNLYNKLYKLIGSVILGIGLVLLPFIPNLISGTYPNEINIYWVYFIFLINTVLSYFLFAYKTSVLNAFQRNDLEYKSNLIVSTLQNVVGILLILYRKNYYLYLYSMIFGTIAKNFLNRYYSNKYFPQYSCKGTISKQKIHNIKTNVMALVFHKIGGTVVNSVDSIVISVYLGIEILAKYSNYFYLISSAEMLIAIVFSGITAGIGNSLILESKDKNCNNFKRILFLNAWIVIIFGNVIISVSQDFIQLWVGKECLLDFYMVILLVCYFFVHSIRRTMLVFRDASGSWKDNKWQPIVSSIFNLSLNILLVKNMGLVGIILSTIVSMVVIDIPWETHVYKMEKIKLSEFYYYKTIVGYFVFFVFSCCISYVIAACIEDTLLVNIIIKFFLSILVTNILFGIVFFNNTEYKFYLNFLYKYIKRIIQRK